jgi:3-oxoacyl-[acyl-carrier-protein] synthase II
MNKDKFNILAQSVFCPGQDVVAVSELQPGQSRQFHYKEASKLLARKGLRYKDEATLIALVAAKKVIEAAPPMSEAQKEHTAVIVSSNLCNLDTVITNSRIIADQHVNETSAMALPNASSNVVSASISIVYGMRGPNLMLCNGSKSGLDALHLAQNLLKAGRADRVLIVGVEVDNVAVQALLPNTKLRFHGAGGYLLEMMEGETPHDYQVTARLRTVEQTVSELSMQEVSRYCGDASAVTGVLQVLLAAEHARNGRPRCLVNGDSAWLVEGP